MVKTDSRIQTEMDHARRILDNADEVWSWASPAGRTRAERRAELLRQAARMGPGTRALELGTGTGVFTELLSRTGAQVTGFDLSVELLNKARRRLDGSPVWWTSGNAERLPFKDGSFDAVIGSSVLHHLRLKEAMRECLRILRPGGRIAFAEPNMLNPQVFVTKNVPWIKRLAGDVPHETAFIRCALKRTLEECGFTVESITPHDFLHPAVPASWIPWVRQIGSWCERIPVVREIAGSLLIVAKKGPHGTHR